MPNKSKIKRRVWIFFLILSLVFVNGLARWRPIETALLTPLVFFNIVIQEGKWRPLDLIVPMPIRESYIFKSSSGRVLQADLYLPRFSPLEFKHPAFIVHVPFAGGGLRDKRLVNIAQTFARAGYAVFIPWKFEDAGIIGSKDVQDVISSFNYLIKDKRINQDKIGLFGISYGNGPTILAAADQKISDKVRFVVSFAGYFDLRNAIDYVLTGRYSYKEISEELAPEQWVKDLLKDNLKSRGVSQQTIERLFANPENFPSLVEAELPGFTQSLANFSPAAVTHKLSPPFLITHSTGDYTIPYTESLRLADSLKDKVPTTLALVKIFIHGNIRPLTWQTWKENYLPSLKDSLNFVYQLLSYRWR